jgi:hypothetical protein
MRSTPLLLLLLAVLAGLGWFFMRGDTDVEVNLENSSQGVDVASPHSGDLPAVNTESSGTSGDRKSIDEPAAVTGATDPLTSEELSSLDANALVGLVVDEEGVGVGNVDVRFLANGLAQFGQAGGVELDWAEMPVVMTNSKGHFRFENLPAGERHVLRVYHSEVALLFVENVVVVDFGEVAEPPITLHYGKRLRGKVTNELDLPLVGVQLHLDGQWRPAGPQASHDRLSAVTDTNGDYEILGVPDGTRCLTAVAKGMGQTTRIQSLIFSDLTGKAHLVNLKLMGASQAEGRITDLDGNGIPGIDVLAVDRKAYRDVGNDKTVSMADGSFSFPNLARGTYQITASAPGYQSVTKVDVTAPTGGINLIMGEQQILRGSVLSATTGKALMAFELQMLFHQRGKDGPAIPRGQPSQFNQSVNGAFEMPFVGVAGIWSVQASAKGFSTSVSETFQVSGRQDVGDVLVNMTQGGSLRGRLVDAAGEPVVGGRITTQDSAWTDDAFSQMVGAEEGTLATVKDARSGHDGSFELLNLRPADYQVILSSSTLHLQSRSGLMVTEAGDLDIGTIVLLAGGSIRGSLLDSEAAPTAGGMVFLSPVDNQSGVTARRCKSDFAGRWSLRNIIPGTYRISGKEPTSTAENPFGSWPSAGGEQVVISGGMDGTRDVHLEGWSKPKPPEPEPPTGQLGGKLLDASGAPLVGRQIRVVPMSEGASPTRAIKTARGGTYSVTRLLPGDYELSVADVPETAQEFTIRIDAWTTQDLQLPQ